MATTWKDLPFEIRAKILQHAIDSIITNVASESECYDYERPWVPAHERMAFRRRCVRRIWPMLLNFLDVMPEMYAEVPKIFQRLDEQYWQARSQPEEILKGMRESRHSGRHYKMEMSEEEIFGLFVCLDGKTCMTRFPSLRHALDDELMMLDLRVKILELLVTMAAMHSRGMEKGASQQQQSNTGHRTGTV